MKIHGAIDTSFITRFKLAPARRRKYTAADFGLTVKESTDGKYIVVPAAQFENLITQLGVMRDLAQEYQEAKKR